MTFAMDITKISDSQFKLKGKTGEAIVSFDGFTLGSLDGTTSRSFAGPGEYEVAGISVIGIKTDETNVFVFEMDRLRVCYLGNTTKKLDDSKVSQIGDIDILLTPITNESIEITQQIESYYIIPYGAKSSEELDKFVKDSGFNVTNTKKFTIKRDDIIEDSTAQIVILDANK